MSQIEEAAPQTDSADICCFDSKLRVRRRDCVQTSLELLEDNLEDHVASLDNAAQLPPVTFPYPADAGFLACFKRPKRSEAPSLLGFLEQQSCTGETFITIWQNYESLESGNHQRITFCCTECPVPKNVWTRNVDLHYIPKNAYQLHEKPTHIDWIDLSGSSAASLTKPYQVTHFLRSILGCAHTQSPWIMHSDHDEKTRAPANFSSDADCVVLLLPGVASEELLEYRVSDASPSWYLHSTVLLQGLTLPFQPWLPLEQNTTKNNECNHLLIYRKLPLRARLSSTHPVTGESAQNLCLWEIVPPPMPTADNEKNEADESVQAEPTFRLVAPPYYDCQTEFPAVMQLVRDFTMRNIILHEAKQIPQWTAWPESTHYGGRRRRLAPDDDDDQNNVETTTIPWHVFPLCYSFPADSVDYRKWIAQTCAVVPQTVQLLKQVLGDSLRTALFSRLEPYAVLEAHSGWQDLANHVIRIHIPVSIPPGGLCGTWVDGMVESHSPESAVAFDDSKIHRAFNYSAEERIVLILDVARPESLPLGTAVGGHSEELDKFIEQMGGRGEQG